MLWEPVKRLPKNILNIYPLIEKKKIHQLQNLLQLVLEMY